MPEGITSGFRNPHVHPWTRAVAAKWVEGLLLIVDPKSRTLICSQVPLPKSSHLHAWDGNSGECFSGMGWVSNCEVGNEEPESGHVGGK